MGMRSLRPLLLAALALISLTACGGAGPPATLADVPAFTDARELKPGEDPRADSLAENMKQAGAIGTSLEQKIFAMPEGATWDSVKSFYDGKLGEGGWQPTNLPVAMPANDMFQLSLYRRGNQNLTVMLLTEPISEDKFLLYSLSQS